jgi:hypothetical protein
VEILLMDFKYLSDELRLEAERSVSSNTWAGTYALSCQALPKASRTAKRSAPQKMYIA